MGKTIEQRVVDFKFNNSNFEQNVAQSMGTLDNLNKKVKESTSGKAFDELTKSAKSMDLSSITTSLTTITEKFSAMKEIAIGALRDIGVSIEQNLVNGLKKVTIEPVTKGFTRFGQKTESVATIMAAIADEDYGDVDKLEYTEALLEKLAWFSDETSYNFTDMTDNIAKFTAAGLDLDTSTTAMMGIATWAANAGQQADVASRAMYQLSQAMGSGSIKLQDWKSIETANMATKEVKQMLIDYGKLMGKIQTDDLGNDFVTYFDALSGKEKIQDINIGNFRDTLTKSQWLDADVFSAAMSEYASYAEALEKIINNEANADLDLYATDVMKKMKKALKESEKTGETLDEIMLRDYGIDLRAEDENGNLVSAMKNVTEIGIRAMESAQKARTLQQAFAALDDASSTKWASAFEKVFGNMEEASELFTYISEVLYDWFAEPLNSLNKMLGVWKEFGGRASLFGYFDEEGELVNGAFQNIIDAMDGYKEAIGKGLSAVFNPEGLGAKELGEKLAAATDRFREFTEAMIPSEETINKVASAVQTFLTPLKAMGGALGSAVSSAKKFGSIFATSFSGAFNYEPPTPQKIKLFGEISEMSIGADDGLAALTILENPLTTISNLFANISNTISRFLNKLTPSNKAISLLNKSLVGMKNALDLLFGPLRKINASLTEVLAPDSTKIEKIAEFVGGPLLESLLWIPSKIDDIVNRLKRINKEFGIFTKLRDILTAASNAIKSFYLQFSRLLTMRIKSGSWLDEFTGEKITGLITPLKLLTYIIKGVKKKIDDFLLSPVKKSNFLSSLASGLDSLLNKIKGFDMLGASMTTLHLITEPIEAIGDVVEKAKNKIGDTKVFDNLGASLSKLASTASSIKNKITSLMSSKLKGKKQQASDVSIVGDGLGFGPVGEGEYDGRPTSVMLDLKEQAEEFANQVEGVMTSVSGVGTVVQKLIEAVKPIATLLFDKLPKLLAGYGVLKLGQGLFNLREGGAISIINIGRSFEILAGGFGSITESLHNFTKGNQIKNIAVGMAAVIASLSTFMISIAICAKLLDGIKNIDDFPKLMGVMALFVGEVIGAVILLTKAASASTLKGAVSMAFMPMLLIGIGASLILIASAVSKIAEVIDKYGSETMESALLSTATLLAAISVMLIALSKFEATKAGGFKSAALLLGAALAIKILASVVKALSEIDENAIRKGEVALLGLTGIVTLLGQVGRGNKQVLKASVALMAMSAALGILVLITKSLSKMDETALVKGELALLGLSGIMNVLGQVGRGNKQIGRASITMIAAAAAISVLVLLTKSLSKLDTEALVKGELALLGLSGIMNTLGQVGRGNKKILTASASMILLSACMAALVALTKKLGEMSLENLAKGVGAMAALALITKQLASIGNNNKKMLMASIAMAILTPAIATMAYITQSLGALSLEQLAKGLGAMELIALIARQLVKIGNTNGIEAFLALVTMSAAINIMANIVKDFAVMDPAGIGQGLLALELLILMAKQLSESNVKTSKSISTALSFIILAEAIYLSGMAIKNLIDVFNDPGITRAGSGGTSPIVIVAGVLLALLAAMEILGRMAKKGDPASLMAAGAALVLMAGALAVVSQVILILAAIAKQDLGSLIAGIAAFAVILGVLVIAAKMIGESTAKGFAIFAAGVLAFGAALILVAKGIDIFVDTILKLGDKINEGKDSLKKGVNAMSEVLVDSIPAMIKALGAIIAAVLGAFLENKVKILEALFEFLDTLLDMLIKWGPTLIEKVLIVLEKLLTALVTFLVDVVIPELARILEALVVAVFDILETILVKLEAFSIRLIEAITNILTSIITAIETVLSQIIESITNLINQIIDAIETTAVNIITSIENILNQIIESITNILSNIITSIETLINQIIDAIENTATNIITAIENILNQIIDSIESVISNIIESIGNLLNQIIDTIENTANNIIDSIETILNNIVDSIENVLSNIIESIGNIINQIIDTIENSANNLIDSVENILNNIIDSIETVFQNILDSVFGLLEDIVDKIVGFADKIKTAALELLQKFVDGIVEATDIVLTGIHDLIVGKDGKGGIVGHIGTFGKDLAEAAGRMIASFIEGIDKAVDSVLTAIKNMIVGENGDGGIVGKIGDFGSDLIKAAGKLIAKFVEGIDKAVDSVMTAIKNLIIGEDGNGGIVGKVGDFGKQVAEAGGKMIGKFVEGIGSAANTVMSAVDSLFNGNNTAENPGIIARLGSFAGNLISSGGQAAASIAEGISKGAKPLISAVDELFNGDGSDENPGILKSIGNFAGKLLTAGGEAVASVATGFRDGAGAAIDAFMSIFDGVKDESGNVIKGKEGILDKIGMLVDSLVSAIIRLINSLADTLRNRSPEFISACGNLADAIISSIPIVGQAYQLGKGVIGSIVSAFKGERKSAEDEGETTGGGIVQGLIRGVGGFAETLGTTVSNVASGIWNGFKNFFGIHSPSTLFTTGGEYLMQGLQNGIEGSDDGPINAMSSIGQSLYDEFNSYQNKFKIAGKTAGDTIGMGAEESDAVTRAAEKLAASVKPGFDKKDSVLKTAGAWASYYVSQGIDNNHSYTDNAARRLANSAKGAFNEINFNDVGVNVVAGINKGIEDNKWRVADKASGLGGTVKNAICTALQIASPSKVMVEIGKFVDTGLAKGIDKYSGDPMDSANDVATMLVYAMSNAMRMAEAALAEDTYTPTISPVIDLAQVQSGINEMNGMLYSADGYSLDAAMRSRYNPHENFDGTEKLDPTLGILGSVDGVTEKLDEMILKLSQLKVYLDSGALVGGIFDQVDLALGKKAIYSGRGVM